MHEMSLAEGVLEIVEDTARRQRREEGRGVWLEIGAAVRRSSARRCASASTR